MKPVVFEWDKLKVQVRSETVRDSLDISSITSIVLELALESGDIAPDNASRITRTRAYWYGRMITTSTILEGEIGFPWIDTDKASAQDIYTSYKGWLDKTPANLWDMWSDAIEKVNNEVLDPEE